MVLRGPTSSPCHRVPTGHEELVVRNRAWHSRGCNGVAGGDTSLDGIRRIVGFATQSFGP
ncbi:MAG: hypothetical protein VCC19_07615 [Myxococcota bacterium]